MTCTRILYTYTMSNDPRERECVQRRQHLQKKIEKQHNIRIYDGTHERCAKKLMLQF